MNEFSQIFHIAVKRFPQIYNSETLWKRIKPYKQLNITMFRTSHTNISTKFIEFFRNKFLRILYALFFFGSKRWWGTGGRIFVYLVVLVSDTTFYTLRSRRAECRFCCIQFCWTVKRHIHSLSLQCWRAFFCAFAYCSLSLSLVMY